MQVEVDVEYLLKSGLKVLAGLVTIVTLRYLYIWFFVPLNYCHTKKRIEYRKEDNKDDVYPNGWYILIDSRTIKKGQVKEMQLCGMDLIVWRGQSGTSYVSDAYCPHLGANLGCGSDVKGECVECPFHGWEFSGAKEGKCVRILGAATIPTGAALKMKRSLERNGWIYVWVHMMDAEPHWEPEEIHEIASGEYKYCGRAEFHLNTYIQDIGENFGDANHLPRVHTPTYLWWDKMNGPDWMTWILPCKWWSSFDPPKDPNSPRSYLDLRSDVGIFNWKIMFYQVFSRGTAEGPGLTRYRFNIFNDGVAVLFVCPSPIDSPYHCRLYQSLYCSSNYPMWIGKAVFLGESIQIARDEVIWNGKRHLKKEMLMKEDKGLKQYKLWYQQFWKNDNNNEKDKENATSGIKPPNWKASIVNGF